MLTEREKSKVHVLLKAELGLLVIALPLSCVDNHYASLTRDYHQNKVVNRTADALSRLLIDAQITVIEADDANYRLIPKEGANSDVLLHIYRLLHGLPVSHRPDVFIRHCEKIDDATDTYRMTFTRC